MILTRSQSSPRERNRIATLIGGFQEELEKVVQEIPKVRREKQHKIRELNREVLKLLQQPFAWEGLKRALRSREIRTESLGQMLSLISTVSLEPEPIPLNVKVVLVGERMLYYLLHYFDPDFGELFKVAPSRARKVFASSRDRAEFTARRRRGEAFNRDAKDSRSVTRGRLLGRPNEKEDG